MPLKIPYYEMDIPRLVTALADWLACLLYLRFLPPRYGGVKRAALYGGALAALALYLVATDGFNGWRFNVLYAVSVALMLLFMAAAIYILSSISYTQLNTPFSARGTM